MAGVGVVLVLAADYAVIRAVVKRLPTASPTTNSSPDIKLGNPSPSPDAVRLRGQSFERGRCYIWNQDAGGATTADEVPCASPHLFEAIEKTNIASDYPAGSAYPTDVQWHEIVDRYCDPIAHRFLGYPLDPHGRFVSHALKPTRSSWESGHRNVVCGLTAVPEKNADRNRAVPFTGPVEGADQARVHRAGTCLELTETENKGPVPCSGSHQAEVTGTATLPDTANGEPPSAAARLDLAHPRCEAAATRFLGRPFKETSTMQVSWLQLAPESWRAGTRTITCMIIFRGAQGKLGAVTGALPRDGSAAAA